MCPAMTVAGRNRSLERLLKLTRGALLIRDCAIGFALTLSAKLRVDAISVEARFPGGTGVHLGKIRSLRIGSGSALRLSGTADSMKLYPARLGRGSSRE